MSDEESLTETETRINDPYASEFRRHLAQVRAHLTGNDGKVLLPSYLPPTGYWTSVEKNAFFHGLSIYSRFRPDLIAACVGTKSVVDVCVYIDALERGASRNLTEHRGRAEIEGSMEVSDAWVEWEEKQSAKLVLVESNWGEEEFKKKKGKDGLDERHWMQEMELRRLDLDDLRVIDTILRNPLSDSGCEPADHSPPSVRPSIPNEMIDPVLLELSISATPNPVEEMTTQPSELSPASRRRLQKRLYMRKKRAEKTGAEFTSVLTRLRPGRKVKERTSTNNPKGKHNSGEDEDSMNLDHTEHPRILSENQYMPQNSDQDDDFPEYAHHSKGGLTKPYKIKKKFDSRGINADILSQGDLGLFHHTTLGRLMELYKSKYSESDTSVATTISADTIRLMTAIVIELVSEVVHRAIVFREQEKDMKGNIKIYGRMHDDITPENITHVLEMMGMKELVIANYSADLSDEEIPTVSEIRSDPEDDYRGSEDSNYSPTSSSSNGDSEGEGSVSFSWDTTLQRELHPPLTHLPKSFTTRDASFEDTLMPMDTDEAELQNELQEEWDIDVADEILAKKYETELWKSSGKEITG